MFFSKNKDKDKNETNDYTKVAALLVHAAKIDENYSAQEKKIIKQALINMGANNENVEKILENGEEAEKDSVQILDFTKKVKSMSHEDKIKIIETLWEIIYSNKEADIYEANLMRRLAGLLYIDNKVMGDIKDKVKKENS